jgi:hypothetical protein
MKMLPGNEMDRRAVRVTRRWLGVLLILVLPLLLGGWHDFTGNTINPNYVKRLQDGKTTKDEVLLWFGDPKKIEKTDLGPVYKYFSYKDTPPDMPYRPENRKINPQSDQQFALDPNQKVVKPKVKTQGKILRSTLIIRFKSDGHTVMSHEYQEF